MSTSLAASGVHHTIKQRREEMRKLKYEDNKAEDHNSRSSGDRVVHRVSPTTVLSTYREQ